MPTSSTLATRLITLQSFKETVWGTSAAATSKWMGVMPLPKFTPYFKATAFEEQRGTLNKTYLAAILQKGGEWEAEMYGTYEDLLYPLFGSFGVVSPTGAGPYTWTFNAPLASAWNAQSYTFEYGYDISTVQAAGCLIDKFSISGEASAEWKAKVSGFYKTHTTNGSLTGGISNRTVEVVLTPVTTLAIDPAGTTPGTTAYANTLISFSYEVETGLKPVYTAGTLEPSAFVYESFVPTLSMTLLYTSAVKSWMSSVLNTGAASVIQLKSTSGTKSVEIDYSGVMTDNYAVYGDKDGAEIIELKFTPLYDSGLANTSKIVVVNSVASLP